MTPWSSVHAFRAREIRLDSEIPVHCTCTNGKRKRRKCCCFQFLCWTGRKCGPDCGIWLAVQKCRVQTLLIFRSFRLRHLWLYLRRCPLLWTRTRIPNLRLVCSLLHQLCKQAPVHSHLHQRRKTSRVFFDKKKQQRRQSTASCTSYQYEKLREAGLANMRRVTEVKENYFDEIFASYSKNSWSAEHMRSSDMTSSHLFSGDSSSSR